MRLETIIGLEVHFQIKTRSKMFCSCPVVNLTAPVNTAICPICMGHPGTLPTLNRSAVELGLRAALAINCHIPKFSRFARKHYFYPDLPKGYQISMYEEPLAVDGSLTLGDRVIRIERLHLEEDAAKLMHGEGTSLVDFNRAGTPLMEIVSQPDIRSPQEARTYLKELQAIMRTVGASDADMESGQMRCDANVSLRPVGQKELGVKTEIKNLNSMRSVEHALRFEIGRQGKLWEAETPPTQLETRGWDDAKSITVVQRVKETSSDYRYFPEPDLPPLTFEKGGLFDIELLKRSLPELPQARRQRFIAEYKISVADAIALTETIPRATWFEHVVSELLAWIEANGGETGGGEAKLAAGWVISKLAGVARERGLTLDDAIVKISAENFGEFVGLVALRRVATTAAKTLLARLLDTNENPTELLSAEGLESSGSDDTLTHAIEAAMASNPDIVSAFEQGKQHVLPVLIGSVMKTMRGRVDALDVKRALEKRLTKD